MVCSAGMDENFVRERMGIDKLPAKVCCAPARSEPPPSYPSPYRTPYFMNIPRETRPPPPSCEPPPPPYCCPYPCSYCTILVS
jgi:hypothetical protein